MTAQEKTEIKLRLETQFKNGVSWFYWIAALSLINTLVVLFEGSWNFIAGLGVTQLIDGFAYAFAESFGSPFIYIGLLINLVIIGVCFVCGFLAHKKKKWAIILGMVFYSLDTILFLIFKDYLSIAFHVYAIFSIFKGYKAINELTKLENVITEETAEVEVEAEAQASATIDDIYTEK